MKRLALTLLCAVAFALPAAARAETPEQKGLRIATEAKKSDDGFGDYSVQGRMILRTAQGEAAVRAFSDRVLEVSGDSDKSVIVFDRPRDVKGVALLTHGHTVGADDQWLYLPAMKRVKRVSSANKTGSFVGSEFAYEDFNSNEVEKYRYRWLRDEACPVEPQLTCHVVERTPADPDSGYRRQVVWLDRQHYRGFKVDYYDRKDTLLKTLTARGYRQYAGRHWRPDQMTMVNHQTGKSTELQLSGYRFGTGLTDRDFDQKRLEHLS